MTEVSTCVWLDNDACPRRVREMVFKAAARLKFKVMIVANSYMHPPGGLDVEVVCAGSAFDAADDYIAEHVKPNNLVITADILLADRVVSQGGLVLTPRGDPLDVDNIKEKLTIRNLNTELRSAGVIHGGPPSMGQDDIGRFAAAFDRLITKICKR